MQTIAIEWQHLDVAGKTCRRCNNTGVKPARANARVGIIRKNT